MHDTILKWVKLYAACSCLSLCMYVHVQHGSLPQPILAITEDVWPSRCKNHSPLDITKSHDHCYCMPPACFQSSTLPSLSRSRASRSACTTICDPPTMSTSYKRHLVTLSVSWLILDPNSLGFASRSPTPIHYRGNPDLSSTLFESTCRKDFFEFAHVEIGVRALTADWRGQPAPAKFEKAHTVVVRIEWFQCQLIAWQFPHRLVVGRLLKWQAIPHSLEFNGTSPQPDETKDV